MLGRVRRFDFVVQRREICISGNGIKDEIQTFDTVTAGKI